jgi:hypothetical protein
MKRTQKEWVLKKDVFLQTSQRQYRLATDYLFIAKPSLSQAGKRVNTLGMKFWFRGNAAGADNMIILFRIIQLYCV